LFHLSFAIGIKAFAGTLAKKTRDDQFLEEGRRAVTIVSGFAL
jgi:hypothetical protein